MTGMILVTGSRGYRNLKLIEQVLSQHDRSLLVIVGGAQGADRMAEVAAKRLGFHVARIDALWQHDRKFAGHERNDVMLSLWSLAPRYALAFWDGESPGTGSMIGKIRRAGFDKLLEVYK